MVRITKQQRDYLENHGCTFPEDLHRTYSKHKTWYATENKKVLSLLRKYMEEIKSK